MTSKTPLHKYTLRLTAGSPQELERFHPNAGGYNVIIRHIIDAHLKKMNEKLNRKLSEKKEMQNEHRAIDADLTGLGLEPTGDGGYQES